VLRPFNRDLVVSASGIAPVTAPPRRSRATGPPTCDSANTTTSTGRSRRSSLSASSSTREGCGKGIRPMVDMEVGPHESAPPLAPELLSLIAWEQSLDFDVFACATCGGRLCGLGAVTEPAMVGLMMERLDLPTDAPRLARAPTPDRAPQGIRCELRLGPTESSPDAGEVPCRRSLWTANPASTQDSWTPASTDNWGVVSPSGSSSPETSCTG
jgi:hypothetical protein